jgi:hypothetical protein
MVHLSSQNREESSDGRLSKYNREEEDSGSLPDMDEMFD